jgi:hypothetical protein
MNLSGYEENGSVYIGSLTYYLLIVRKKHEPRMRNMVDESIIYILLGIIVLLAGIILGIILIIKMIAGGRRSIRYRR